MFVTETRAEAAADDEDDAEVAPAAAVTAE
jgi:hypothetical protein